MWNVFITKIVNITERKLKQNGTKVLKTSNSISFVFSSLQLSHYFIKESLIKTINFYSVIKKRQKHTFFIKQL